MMIVEKLIHFGGMVVPPAWADYAKHFVKWEVFSERILENPLIIRHLPEKPSRVLDVGSRYSQVPLEMAALGHTVVALDIFDYIFHNDRVTFVKEDIRRTSFPDSTFDVVTIISTIEHVGLGETSYGDAKEKNGDIEAMKEIYRILKPGGVVLITIPFGRPKVLPFLRVYDLKRIKRMAKNFRIVKAVFMKNEPGGWNIRPYKAVKDIENTNHTIGNSFFVLKSKKK